MPRIISGFLTILVCAGLTTGAETASSSDDKAKSLVLQLGDNSFTLREEAAKRLLQLGRSAKSALVLGLKSDDLEVRKRCQELLVTVIEEDFKARLDAFIADKEGKKEHDLPGWNRYRKLIGADAQAKELFVEMAKSHGVLLEEAEASPKTAGDRYAGECQAMWQRVYQPVQGQRTPLTLGNVATLLFVGSDPEIPISEQARQQAANLLYQPAFNNAVRTGPKVAHLQKLLGGWMRQATGIAASQSLQMAMQFNLKEGLELALKLIKDKDYANGMTLAAVGKLGSKEHLPLLEPLLKDETVITNFQFNNQAGVTQVRDIALAMTIHLNGQPIKDYGFEFMRGNNNDQIFSSTLFLGFGDQAKRDASFKKWQEWAAKQGK